jgi:hypothetical protein
VVGEDEGRTRSLDRKGILSFPLLSLSTDIIIIHDTQAKLRDLHSVVLQNRLEQLRKKQRDEAEKMKDILAHEELNSRPTPMEVSEPLVDEPREEWVSEEMEPRKLTRVEIGDLDKRLELVDPLESHASLLSARKKVSESRFVPIRNRPTRTDGDQGSSAMAGGSGNGGMGTGLGGEVDAVFAAEIARGLDEEEEVFNVEEQMGGKVYAWEDKYRPRKPRYFNKVHTGYEWSESHHIPE